MSELDAKIRQLFDRASAGDEEAIGEMVRRFEPEIRLVARRQLGTALRPYLDSMDLAQSIHRDLLVGLRDGKFEFSSKRQFMAFVTSLVRWKAARHWRKHRRQQRQSGVALSSEGLPDVIASLQARDGQEFDIADLEQIASLMNQLDEKERELITLRLEGFSTAEVARQLNVSPDVTRVRLSRLRKRLRNANWVAKLI